jgi:hypothetical protein
LVWLLYGPILFYVPQLYPNVSLSLVLDFNLVANGSTVKPIFGTLEIYDLGLFKTKGN